MSRLEKAFAILTAVVFGCAMLFPVGQRVRQSINSLNAEKAVSTALQTTGLDRAVHANVISARRQAEHFGRRMDRTSRLLETEVLPGVSHKLESTRLATVDKLRESMERTSRAFDGGVGSILQGIYAGRSSPSEQMGPLSAEPDDSMR